jgi:hypothetical protein
VAGAKEGLDAAAEQLKVAGHVSQKLAHARPSNGRWCRKLALS